jgi:hypothetical protein
MVVSSFGAGFVSTPQQVSTAFTVIARDRRG